MTDATFAIGIDLGTTHTALARLRLDERSARTETVDVPQLVARGTLDARTLLPSFVYCGHASEGVHALPWDPDRTYVVGELARQRSIDAPARVISSAKSWLSHTGIDRHSAVLPVGAPEDVEKVSPVEALWRLLNHLSEAWQAERGSGGRPLGEESVVLTVPASFDVAARDLTMEAAHAAGLDNATLLEEPQAALYAWIERQGDEWRQHLSVGDVVLVVDIGGGTTEFSAIAVNERDGDLELRPIAVSNHILLGGDSMDLALGHALRMGLPDKGKSLDGWQFASLVHSCRAAKERLLAADGPATVPVAAQGRRTELVGEALRTELTRKLVEQIVVEGFFPKVEPSARPATRQRTGFTQLGLPYAAPAVTRHLAAFLGQQARAATEPGDSGISAESSDFLRFTRVLFNGGVLKAPIVRDRLMATLNGWQQLQGAPPARLLPGDDPDLAVARGAAYYGLVRRGRGIPIRGGTARAYSVAAQGPVPAVEPSASTALRGSLPPTDSTQARMRIRRWDGPAGYEHAPGSRKRFVGLGVAVVSHALLIHAFTSGLATKLAHGVKRRVEVAIIQDAIPPPPPPPPEKKKAEEPKPRPRPKPKKAWQPKPEVVTSSTESDNAISSTTEDVEEAIAKPEPVVREAPPPKKKRRVVRRRKKRKTTKKKVVKTRPRLMPGCRLPRYPRRSEEKGEEGTVVLRFLVGPDGTVQRSELVRSSGHPRLDNAAKKAFARCKFKPGTVDGVQVASWVRQPFTWRLQ